MNYPLISEYIDSIMSAEDNFDKLNYLRPVLDTDGLPIMSSGNFAVVFKMKAVQSGKYYAIKCFLIEQEGREESYRLIEEELEKITSPYLISIHYITKELFVDTNQTSETEFPVLQMDWIEGQTLDKYLRENINNKYNIEMLTYRFSLMTQWLMSQPFAHGDLKPDNIFICNNGEIVLVDYDGMYVPTMKGQKARELGSPDFRHPLRSENDFDEHIDDFSLVSILLSLKIISIEPKLLNKYGTIDKLLFSQNDYCNLSNCKVLFDLYDLLNDIELTRLLGIFLYSCSKKETNLIKEDFNLKQPQVIYIEEVLTTNVTKEDLDTAWVDDNGVKYSNDGKRLLKAPSNLALYSIRDGVKIICDNAFHSCGSLQNIFIPDGVEKIGNRSFEYCVSLEKVKIPNSVKSIGKYAFSACLYLKEIHIPNTISNIEDGAFSHCETLQAIKLPNTIERLNEELFLCCNSLRSVVFPNNLIFIGKKAFYGCSSLESIEIPNSLEIIGDHTFAYCKSLKTISLPTKIKTIEAFAFYKCQDLEFVQILSSKINISTYVFDGCSSLKMIKIPYGSHNYFTKIISNLSNLIEEQ